MENVKFLTTEEACERLGVSPQVLSYMVSSGKISNYSRGHGRRVYYRECDVDGILEFRKNEKREAA